MSAGRMSGSYAMCLSYENFAKSQKVCNFGLWPSKTQDLALILFVKCKEECKESAEVVCA